MTQGLDLIITPTEDTIGTHAGSMALISDATRNFSDFAKSAVLFW